MPGKWVLHIPISLKPQFEQCIMSSGGKSSHLVEKSSCGSWWCHINQSTHLKLWVLCSGTVESVINRRSPTEALSDLKVTFKVFQLERYTIMHNKTWPLMVFIFITCLSFCLLRLTNRNFLWENVVLLSLANSGLNLALTHILWFSFTCNTRQHESDFSTNLFYTFHHLPVSKVKSEITHVFYTSKTECLGFTSSWFLPFLLILTALTSIVLRHSRQHVSADKTQINLLPAQHQMLEMKLAFSRSEAGCCHHELRLKLS